MNIKDIQKFDQLKLCCLHGLVDNLSRHFRTCAVRAVSKFHQLEEIIFIPSTGRH